MACVPLCRPFVHSAVTDFEQRAHTQGFLSRKKSTAINLHQELSPRGAGWVERLPESVCTILHVWAFFWWVGLLFPLDASAEDLLCVLPTPLPPWPPSSVHAAWTDRFSWVFSLSQLMEDSEGDGKGQGSGAQLLPCGAAEGWLCLSAADPSLAQGVLHLCFVAMASSSRLSGLWVLGALLCLAQGASHTAL